MESKKVKCSCSDPQRGIVFNPVDGTIRCCVCFEVIFDTVADLSMAKLIGIWHTLPDELRELIKERIG